MSEFKTGDIVIVVDTKYPCIYYKTGDVGVKMKNGEIDFSKHTTNYYGAGIWSCADFKLRLYKHQSDVQGSRIDLGNNYE